MTDYFLSEMDIFINYFKVLITLSISFVNLVSILLESFIDLMFLIFDKQLFKSIYTDVTDGLSLDLLMLELVLTYF